MRATVGPRQSERFLAGVHVEHGAHVSLEPHWPRPRRLPSGLRAGRSGPGSQDRRDHPVLDRSASGPDPPAPPRAAATSDPSALNDGPHARRAPPSSRGVAPSRDPTPSAFRPPSRGEPRAIRAERDVVHIAIVSLERADALPVSASLMSIRPESSRPSVTKTPWGSRRGGPPPPHLQVEPGSHARGGGPPPLPGEPSVRRAGGLDGLDGEQDADLGVGLEVRQSGRGELPRRGDPASRSALPR